MEVSSEVARSRKRHKSICHPFKNAEEFEASIAPYMVLDEPRHLHCHLRGTDFRARLMRSGVLWACLREDRVASGKFKGTLSEFLHDAFNSIAALDDDTNEEDFGDVDREIMRLYRIHSYQRNSE